MRPALRVRVAVAGARLALSALMRTCRFSEVNGGTFRALVGSGQPVIFSLWHGRLLPLTWFYRHYGFVPMISRSGDGEYIARLAAQWGYIPVRGSSSRGGGEALREMLQACEEGRSLVFTPDGPRGPFQELKPGVLRAAQLSGCPIIPITAGAARASFYGHWDRFLVPHPFTRVVILIGDPIMVPQNADAALLMRKQSEVQEAMNAITTQVDALVGGS